MSGAHDRDVDERLADWVDGRMTERERARFEGELRVNPKLRADLAEYERTVAVMRAALRAPTQPVSVADRVLARLAAPAPAASTPVRRPRQWRGFAPLGWSLASAAALMALAVLVDSWSRRDSVDKLVAQAPPGASRDAAGEPTGSLGVEVRSDEFEQLARSSDGAPAAPNEPPPVAGQAGTEAKVATASDPGEAALQQAAAGAEKDGKPPTALEFAKSQSTEPLGRPATPVIAGAASDADKDKAEVAAPPAATAPATPVPDRNLEELTAGANKAEVRRGAPAPGGKVSAGLPANPSGANSPASAGVPVMLALIDVEGDVEPIVRAANEPPLREQNGESPPDSEATRSRAKQDAKRGEGEPPAVPARLTDGQLQERVYGFFAKELAANAPAEGRFETSRGALQLAPFALEPVAGVRSERNPPDGGGGGAGAAPVRELVWLVEGDRTDLQLLLARVSDLVRERKWQLRSGETAIPPTPRFGVAEDEAGLAKAKAAAPDASVPAVPVRERLVLRFRLRAR